MNKLLAFFTILISALGLMLLQGCDSGKDAEDHLDDAGDSISDAAEDAGDAISDAADDAKDELKEHSAN